MPNWNWGGEQQDKSQILQQNLAPLSSQDGLGTPMAYTHQRTASGSMARKTGTEWCVPDMRTLGERDTDPRLRRVRRGHTNLGALPHPQTHG